MVTQGGMVEGGGVTGVTMQAENVLYAGTEQAIEMRHKTLTMDKASSFRKFRGSTTPEVQFEASDGGKGCKGCFVVLWGCGVSVMVVLALGAAAIALAIIFTGFVDVCQCQGSGKTNI